MDNEQTPHDPADSPAPLDDPTAAPSSATRARIVLGISAAAVLGLLGWFLFMGDSPEPAPVSTTTTTTTTTTEPQDDVRPAQVSQVATAKEGVATIQVRSEPPVDWETAQPVTVWEAPELASSQAEFTGRPELPRLDYPIEGRKATPSGYQFANPSPFGDTLTFLVTETRGDWAKVMLPVRPNHTEGWINLNDVDLSEHEYRVELTLAEHNLKVYHGTEVITDTQVVVGKDSSRTPTGRFFITDKVDRSNPDGFFGPHVLPLNGYSEQMDIFDEGVPVIAIHGTSRPDLLGQDASNGCVRIPNEVVTQLNAELPIGTPVEIYA